LLMSMSLHVKLQQKSDPAQALQHTAAHAAPLSEFL
jgi:hypothetical protein